MTLESTTHMTSAQLQIIESDKQIISGRPALFKSCNAGYIPMDTIGWFFSGPYFYSAHEIEGYDSTGTGWDTVDTYWSKINCYLSPSYDDAFDNNRAFKLPESRWKGFISCEKLDISNPEHFKLICTTYGDHQSYLSEMKGTVIYDIIKKSTLEGSPFAGCQIADVFSAYFEALKGIKGLSTATILRHKEARDRPDELKGVNCKNIPKIMKKREDIRNLSCAIDHTKTKIRDAERTIQSYHQKIQELNKDIENTEKEITELKNI